MKPVVAAASPSPIPAAAKQTAIRRSYPACNVCGKDLTNERSFHQRYHVCPEDATADAVQYGGMLQRFCQQCGRFHELERFDHSMRSCRSQLAKHAERRRKRRAEAAAARARVKVLALDALAKPPSNHASASDKASTSLPAPAAPLLLAMPAPVMLPMPREAGPLVHAAGAVAAHGRSPAKRQRTDRSRDAVSQLLQQQLPPLPQPEGQQEAGQRVSSGSAADKSHEGGSASMQSTHSTQQQHSSQGLDALLAAAEEEEQLSKQQLQQQAMAGARPAPAPAEAVAAATLTSSDLPDLSWLGSAAQAQQPLLPLPPIPASLAAEQEDMLAQLLPAVLQQQQLQQPLALQLAGLVAQPQWQQTAPACLPPPPPDAPAAPQMLQLLQHLASPAASSALALLGHQFTGPKASQAPPVGLAAPLVAALTQHQQHAAPPPASIAAALTQLVRQQGVGSGIHALVGLLCQQPPEQKTAQLQQVLRMLVQG